VICSLLFEVEAAGAAGLPEQASDALRAFEGLVPNEQPLWLRNLSLRARAALCATRHDLPGARDALEEAVAEPDPQVPFEAARTELAYGVLLRRMRQHSAGRAALTTAHGIFERLGADAWAARATDELARVPGRRAHDRSELTDAERRIVEIVIGGKSNKEVAATLFLSVKTVEITLTRVYRKLGVRSRTELAARMADEGKSL
jgi:DNA-binding CsgD family transcriptional regulator